MQNRIYQIIANHQNAYFVITFLILLITTIVSYPLYYVPDLNFHMIRFEALSEAIKDGNFPIYIDYKAINV